MLITNTHIQSTQTYSPFNSIAELVRCAREENIAALGITDLNAIDGFREFAVTCTRQGVYPLFNIKFSVHDFHSDAGESPVQPCFIHGKALHYPATLSDDVHNLIASVWKGSQDRIWKMIGKINELAAQRELSCRLDYNEIRSRSGTTSIVERNLADALYRECFASGSSHDARLSHLRRLLNNPSLSIDTDNSALVQDAIMKHLLDYGGEAYITGQCASDLSHLQARQLILSAGGIPCYQLSAGPTGSENNHDPITTSISLAKHLKNQNIHAVEFIPGQWSFNELSICMRFFHDQHFCVTVGTIHEKPEPISFIPVTADGRSLDTSLLTISYQGACILAAHQERHRQRRRGFTDEYGRLHLNSEELAAFISLGDNAIRHTHSRQKSAD